MADRVYFENLDGLRAVAALAVVGFHIANWIPSEDLFSSNLKTIISFSYEGGKLGVIFFFILSGFLISYLLLHEQTSNNKINLGNFYLRRVLRIWPLYYVTLIVGFIGYPLYNPNSTINASPAYYALFLTNFDHILNGGPGLGILGVQWSVAVEEQFYLFWPLIFAFRQKKIKLALILVCVALSEVFCLINAEDRSAVYYHFFSCIRFLGFGALIALFVYYKKDWLDWLFSKFSKLSTLAVYCVCLALLFFGGSASFAGYECLLEFLPFIFFSFVILEQSYNTHSVFKMANFKVLTWMGKISYGIYLTHMIAIYFVNELPEVWFLKIFLVKMLVATTLTIVFSYLSYRFIEAPFLQIKRALSVVEKQPLPRPKP